MSFVFPFFLYQFFLRKVILVFVCVCVWCVALQWVLPGTRETELPVQPQRQQWGGGDPGQDYQQTTMKQGAKVDTQLAQAAKNLPSHSRQHRFHVYVC